MAKNKIAHPQAQELLRIEYERGLKDAREQLYKEEADRRREERENDDAQLALRTNRLAAISEAAKRMIQTMSDLSRGDRVEAIDIAGRMYGIDMRKEKN